MRKRRVDSMRKEKKRERERIEGNGRKDKKT